MDKITMDIDRFFDLVAERKEVTTKEVATVMSVGEENVERWTRALGEVVIVTFHYLIVGKKSSAKIRIRD